ncbi:MAG: hypothetical protein AAFO15_02025 [Pseudomonadota bacterium]
MLFFLIILMNFITSYCSHSIYIYDQDQSKWIISNQPMPEYNICFSDKIPIEGIVLSQISDYNLQFEIDTNLSNIFITINTAHEKFTQNIKYNIYGTRPSSIPIKQIYINGTLKYIDFYNL